MVRESLGNPCCQHDSMMMMMMMMMESSLNSEFSSYLASCRAKSKKIQTTSARFEFGSHKGRAISVIRKLIKASKI